MKGTVWLVFIAVVLVVLGGLFVYRSTAPNGDVVPEGETSLEEAGGVAPSNQFLQIQPEGDPPIVGEGGDSTASSEASTPPGAGSEAGEANGETVTVAMTDTGFDPDNLTVRSGTRVIFLNNGQALHWPASDVHPTHEVLSAFDGRRGVATGDSYSYTFTEVGSWSFHDHLNPQFVGTITVE